MSIKRIVIGTRGSKLSLMQTHIVKDLLQAKLPHTTIEITTITTSGDKNLSPIPLDTIGKGWFTKEIDKQLLEGKIDLAVHSLKDLLDTLTPGLVITAIPEREDASEALISRNNVPFNKLKRGAVIGTDSIRRRMQIVQMRRDLVVKSVRGNVNKRLEKLDSGEYDGLILATAGLKRLGLQNRIAQHFTVTEIIPSPGQGALAIVSKSDNKALNTILSKLNHIPSVTAVTAERVFSSATGGGCSMPVGAYAEIKGKTITLFGMLGSEDEKHVIKDSIHGNIKESKLLARKLADKLLKKSSLWQTKPRIVVLTREEKDNITFAKKIEKYGLQTLSCPSISITKNLTTQELKKYFLDIPSFDWIIFTSSNGVKFFMEGLKDVGKNKSLLKNIQLAAVGKKTAKAAKKYDVSISFIPKIFTAKNLGRELTNLQGKKILLPRSTITNADIKNQLQKKGAHVFDMPVYKTETLTINMTNFEKLMSKNQILCLTFTSPSTVTGFLKNIEKSVQQAVLSLPVISIGPVTTSAAKKHGFKNVFTADIHTTEGILTKLQENIL